MRSSKDGLDSKTSRKSNSGGEEGREGGQVREGRGREGRIRRKKAHESLLGTFIFRVRYCPSPDEKIN